jgi:type IV pilus assembly protein PilW
MNNLHHKFNAGFTLIEILVAMAVSTIVLTGIYQAYANQMRVNNTQNQVVEMQQSARVAMLFMERDIRQAGFNPTGMANVGIDVAGSNEIRLSIDETGGEGDGEDNDLDGLEDETPECDGVSDGQIIYTLSNDNNDNGVNDALEGLNTNACHLTRNGQRLASNIDALNFVYFGIDDDDASCQENCALLNPTTAQERGDIRAVQISVVARAGTTIPGFSIPFTDNNTYYNQPPSNQIILPPQIDGFRRVRLITEVRSRNIGLK